MAFPHDKLGRDGINKQKKVGPVLVNGVLHNNLIASAKNSVKPYYAKATGADNNNYGTVRDGEIAITVVSSIAAYNAMSYEMNSCSATGGGKNNQVKAITTLNGLFDGMVDIEAINKRIHVYGIVEVSNDESGSRVYNILTGGTFTIPNTGNEAITVGDAIMAIAPSRELAPSMGRGKGPDENGERKMCTVPFRPEKHKMHNKAVWNCLQEDKKFQSYLPAYKECCHVLDDSLGDIFLLGLAAVGSAADFQRFKDIVNVPLQTASGLANAMEPIVHASDKAYRKRLRGQAFAEYSGDQRPSKMLNMDPVGALLVSHAYLWQETRNKIIGKAMTSTAPLCDFVISLDCQ